MKLDSHHLKVGLVGAGAIVESNHLPVLRSRSDMDVAWVLDRDPRRSALMSAMYGVPALAETDLERGLREVDLCILAIPYGARGPYFQRCAALGKAVCAEKPFALTVAEHEKLCAMFPASRLAIGLQRRFYRSVAVLGEVVRSGIFGQVVGAHLAQGHFQLKGGAGYRSDAAMAGGGVIIESAIHALDQLLFVTGAHSVVLGECRVLHRNGLDQDAVFESELEWAGGRLQVTCEISSLRNLGTFLELIFESARIRTDLSPGGPLLIMREAAAAERFELDGAAGGDAGARTVQGAFHRFWDAWLHAMASGEETPALARTSLVTTRWIEQVYDHMAAT